MILEIAQYEHPALRTKGRTIATIDDAIHQLVADMVETMRAAEGIGLAAQQVGRPLQLFVLDVAQTKEHPSRMRIAGKSVEFDDMMPLAVINPVITPFGRIRAASEGCLSFPGLRGDVLRPMAVRVKALAIDGSSLEFEAEGLLGRAVQHEFDHLQGILYLDRMSPPDLANLPSQAQRLARPVPPS